MSYPTVNTDITVTNPNTQAMDITVTDLSSVVIDPKYGTVVYDFRLSNSLLNNNKYTIQRELTLNGTVTYNQSGYYDLGASIANYISLPNDLSSKLPPLPHTSHQWFEMTLIVYVASDDPSYSILTNQGNGGVIGDGYLFRYATTNNTSVVYYKNDVLISGNTASDTLSGLITATFSAYYDGANTYLKSVVDGTTWINDTVAGDKRIESNDENTIFGFSSGTSQIHLIKWEHSDTKTNSDFA